MDFAEDKHRRAEPEFEDIADEEEPIQKEPQIDEKRLAACFDSPDGKAMMFVLVGKSFKGKSHFIKWLVFNKFIYGRPPWEFGIVFAKTKFNSGYDYIPDNKVFQGYDERVLRKYISNLENVIQENGSIAPSFVIFDDLVGILNNQTQWFINFISTHRHYNVNIIIAAQYLTGRNAISPIMREQTSVAVLFNSKTRRTLENLYESYGQLFPTLREFQDYFFTVTKEPYVAMVYFEDRDELSENYVPMIAPADLPNKRLQF